MRFACATAHKMVHLTNWEAEKDGFLQGTGTPGEVLGRALDWCLAKIGKLPKLPKPKPFHDHWSTWPDGNSLEITDAWLDKMIQDGRLPTREQVTYSGNRKDRAEARAMMGSHVIVEMLNTDRKTRHRCILLGNVLIADRDGWDASLKTTS